ncbi:AGL244Cp [Eremothecium gossypii ATCC 10895]|uniref:AGL244Cp n=1 Tax=Eremothecium gossypii (strain ATCC 10895 / CBS 109.51 / FGSC 9923 / NRRL Y-1056) TaxID=284811 RepID=Q751F0_EREGS|nr:AGL244Cp [Eremothecium gossypii ATCC 10895]AAS54247.1 AGL244Cp [Eremothecium gossypii ATCC 10895]AEY98573.1 FAGL244Cp [Eremothecium gossypii FDAG1]
MSQLKVLTVGENPNVLLYTWRLQEAKAVELWHVSGHRVGGKFGISTQLYGEASFSVQRHYETLDALKQAVGQGAFDMVILSAPSLQEMSSLAYQLNTLVDATTKIFVESSGFVLLEPFVKMSVEFADLQVLSIVSDYDIRQTGETTFEQFNARERQTIYIGKSGVKGKNTATRYSKDVASLLETFQSFFRKLFSRDAIDICNCSYVEFLSQQWRLAIPQICFDPLLILMEELRPQQLQEHILAKPLISGFVTEIITVSRSMGAKLLYPFDSENDLFNHWVTINNQDLPKMVYHFMQRTASLDIDMLLLQPILLADDHGIKTPYLEFLYSMMCQFQKINNGHSRWFTRVSAASQMQINIQNVTAERDALNTELELLKQYMVEKENTMNEAQRSQEQLFLAQVGELKSEVARLKDDLGLEKRKNTELLMDLQRSKVNKTPAANPPPMAPPPRAQSPVIPPPKSVYEQHDSDGGTPDMADIQEFAMYGITYDDEPEKKDTPPSGANNEAQPDEANNEAHPDGQGSPSMSAFSQRDRDPRSRDLDQQRRGYPPGVPYQGHPGMPPQMMYNGSSKPHMYPPAAMKAARAAAMVNYRPVANNSRANSLVDPYPPPQLGQAASAYPQTFKKTDRKNRQSHMPSLRNASSTGFDDFSVPQGVPHGMPRIHQRGYGNPAHRMTLQTPLNYQQKLNSMHGSHAQQKQIQRQISAASALDDGNTITAMVQHLMPKKKDQPPQQQGPYGSPPNSGNSSTYGGSPAATAPSASVNAPAADDGQNAVPQPHSAPALSANGNTAPMSGNSVSLSNGSSAGPGLSQQSNSLDWKQTPPSSGGSVTERKPKLALFAKKK